MEQDGDYITYSLRSKSLTALLQRATLLVEALGDSRRVDIDHYIGQNKRGKDRHFIEVSVS